jgi:hypothetical protein
MAYPVKEGELLKSKQRPARLGDGWWSGSKAHGDFEIQQSKIASLPHFWTDDRHPCKSLVKGKARALRARSGESALLVQSRSAAAHVCLSADGSCIPAEPDIHLLPQAAKSRRRRLSLCSLPVPKQSEESLGSCLRRPAGHMRDLAACASGDPDVFPSREGFYAAAVRMNSPAGTKSVFRLSTANMWATIFLATASVARLALPRCRSLS